MDAPRSVVIREVGLRDGLQSIARILPTDQKLEWIRDAHADPPLPGFGLARQERPSGRRTTDLYPQAPT